MQGQGNNPVNERMQVAIEAPRREAQASNLGPMVTGCLH